MHSTGKFADTDSRYSLHFSRQQTMERCDYAAGDGDDGDTGNAGDDDGDAGDDDDVGNAGVDDDQHDTLMQIVMDKQTCSCVQRFHICRVKVASYRGSRDCVIT